MPATITSPYAAGLLAIVAFASPLAGQPCWSPGPAHGARGSDTTLFSSTLWDPDGGGPLAPTLVVGPAENSRNVQMWNGWGWTALGGVFNGLVYDLEVLSGQLYASGSFTQIGATPINGIARWNGSAWVQVGSGLGTAQGSFNFGRVETMCALNGVLYIGGVFPLPASNTTGTFAAWNGSAWLSVPQAASTVHKLLPYGGQLHAAAGIGNPSGVYRYNGAWTQIGSANGVVYSLGVLGSELFAGGSFFQMAGQPSTNRIARWNGSSWLPLGSGMSNGPNDEVLTMATYRNLLVVGGVFSGAGGVPASNVASWDGISWSALDGGIHYANQLLDTLWGLEPWGNDLIAVGRFPTAGAYAVNNAAVWTSASWLPLGAGINGRVRALLPAGGTGVYAGGYFDFTWPGSGRVAHIMGTDGAGSVNPVSDINGFRGTDGIVNALGYHTFNLAQGPRLIIGGSFSFAGGNPAANIASYDLFSAIGGYGQVGAGLNSAVAAVQSYGGSLYAAGIFTASGATPLPHLAKLVSGNWVSPGNWSFNSIQALAVQGGRLIIGGVNSNQEGVSAWDGTTLTALGVANAPVYALASYGPDLIAAGNFTSIGGVTAARVARRDSATGQWSAMGAGLGSGGVFALAVHEGQLYAGGGFVQTGVTQTYRLARWDGSAWAPVPLDGTPAGLDDAVYSLASAGGVLHVGGDFRETTNGAYAPDWAVYTCGCYGNCDGSAAAPVLNVADFTCFLQRFAAADAYANCDGSTQAPTLNVADFTCFLQRFAAGCPTP